MHREVDVTQYEAARKRRTVISGILIFLVIPATVLGGSLLIGSDFYMVGSALILIYTMIPFFMVFEHRKPKAREIVLIAMMAALTVVIQLFFHITVPIQAGTALVIISGISLGPEAGFLIGALPDSCAISTWVRDRGRRGRCSAGASWGSSRDSYSTRWIWIS